MDISAPNKYVRDFIQTILKGISVKLSRSTVPIVYDSVDHAYVYGTAVLFKILDHLLLLSASHILKFCKNATFHDTIGIPLSDDQMLPIVSGNIYFGSDDDNYDVGFVELPKDAADLLQKNRNVDFLTVADVEDIDHKSPPEGGYVVFGYPNQGTDCSSGVVTPIPHYLSCTPHKGDTSDLPHTYNPTMHFLLRFDRNALWDIETGELSEAPHPGGMSGGSVWWTYSPHDITNGWDPTYARFVGIQSAYFSKSGLLKVIPWHYMQSIIVKIKPGWESALSLRSSGRLTQKLIAEEH
jgi:hypothetical protein